MGATVVNASVLLFLIFKPDLSATYPILGIYSQRGRQDRMMDEPLEGTQPRAANGIKSTSYQIVACRPCLMRLNLAKKLYLRQCPQHAVFGAEGAAPGWPLGMLRPRSAAFLLIYAPGDAGVGGK